MHYPVKGPIREGFNIQTCCSREQGGRKTNSALRGSLYVLCACAVLYVLHELYVLHVLYVLYDFLFVLYVLYVLYALYVLYVLLLYVLHEYSSPSP